MFITKLRAILWRLSGIMLVIVVVSLTQAAYAGSNSNGADRIDVCHLPGGNPAKQRVIQVGSEQALQAHLDHGDTVFGTGLAQDCSGGLRFEIDANLMPSVATLPGLLGGDPRPVGVVAGPNGGSDEIVVHEVQLHPGSPTELAEFLARYGGTVVIGDSVPDLQDDGTIVEVPAANGGWYLIHVDLETSGLADLAQLALDAEITEGSFVLSSDATARALALQLRELARAMRPNFLFYSLATPDHPDGSGGNIDFVSMWWMNTDDDPDDPGDQGLSISTDRAWSWLRNTGLPPVLTNEEWFPAEVALVDTDFNLDPNTGLGSRDYHDCERSPSLNLRCDDPSVPPKQIDMLQHDMTAGVFTGQWHGESMVGVCCAFPGNKFGGAGSGGEYVTPFPYRTDDEFSMAMAVRSAAFRSLPVISISRGTRCDWSFGLSSFCAAGDATGYIDDDNFQQAVLTATTFDSVVIAAAGNGTQATGAGSNSPDNNIDSQEWRPCTLDHVICVGAVNRQGNNEFNWGNKVDIWGPGTRLGDQRSTVTPASAGLDSNDVGLDEVAWTSATSAATAYVSGVAAMLKSVQPTLRWNEVQAILQETANCSIEFPANPCPTGSPDPMAHYGWIDAERAARRVRVAANPAPTVEIISPFAGESLSWYQPITFTVRTDDDPNPDGFTGTISVASNPVGVMCSAQVSGLINACVANNNRGADITALGTHMVTVTATDEFGAFSVSEPLSIEITNATPQVTLTSPANNSVVFTDQLVTFRARLSDEDLEVFGNCAVQASGPCVGWSIDGGPLQIPAGGTVLKFSTSLSEGMHTITVNALDGQGASDAASIMLEVLVGTGNPTARIVSALPPSVGTGEIISFTGEGFDPEDGDLSGESLQWFSDLDGNIGSGSPLNTDQLSGPVGDGITFHTITLVVTDADNNSATDQIIVSVGQID